jgi:hypothetical protein
VEAGRWSHSRPDFMTAPRAQFSASRAKRTAHVSADMAATGGRRSDQGEVWQDISVKMGALGSRSDTQAVESVFVDHESRLRGYVDALRPAATQLGAVFCIGSRVIGMELFDSQQTCAALLPKIIRSYALDAIDPRMQGNGGPDPDSPERFLQSIAGAKTNEAPAVGEGTDIRFDNASGVAGGALLARDRIVHLVAFAMRGSTLHSSDRVYRRHGF